MRETQAIFLPLVMMTKRLLSKKLQNQPITWKREIRR